jgi:hypothetical protein
MATMGRRTMRSEDPVGKQASPETIFVPVNRIIAPGSIQYSASMGIPPPPPGTPIMREGFVTSTGFLLQSPEVQIAPAGVFDDHGSF